MEYDRKTIEGLVARGFKYDPGEDGAGHQWKVRTRYGGYYLDAGCAQLIIDGEVGLLQFDDIERFVEEGALMKDGSVKAADLIILATGFVQPASARRQAPRRGDGRESRAGLGFRTRRRDE